MSSSESLKNRRFRPQMRVPFHLTGALITVSSAQHSSVTSATDRDVPRLPPRARDGPSKRTIRTPQSPPLRGTIPRNGATCGRRMVAQGGLSGSRTAGDFSSAYTPRTPIPRTPRTPCVTLSSARWRIVSGCRRRDSNPHAWAPSLKLGASANSATPAQRPLEAPLRASRGIRLLPYRLPANDPQVARLGRPGGIAA